MKILDYIYMSVAAMVCVSCVVPFDLKLEDDPVIFLESFPGTEDKVVFRIHPAYSYSNSAETPEFIPEISFLVNDREVPVVLNACNCMGEDYPAECYVADYRPVPGDRMSVEVTAPGFKGVSAQTTVPEAFPERRIDYRKVVIGDRNYNVVYVTFEDDRRDGLAYGLQIHEETTCFFSDGESATYAYPYAGWQIYDDYDFAPHSLEGMRLYFDGWQMGGGSSLAGWDSRSFSGSTRTLSTSVQAVGTGEISAHDSFYEHYIEGDRYSEDGEEIIGTYTGVIHNKLVLYTMTDEFYKYAVAQELVQDNSNVIAGIAPSNFCYSNVRNGYGAFAGVYKVETEWITPEFIEENR